MQNQVLQKWFSYPDVDFKAGFTYVQIGCGFPQAREPGIRLLGTWVVFFLHKTLGMIY